METQGIRILDTENNLVSVSLRDILGEIDDVGERFMWSILFFDGMGSLKKWDSLDDFENKVNKSDRGLFITWKNLIELTDQFDEIIDILIIGNMNEKNLIRYENEEMMYRSCDFVINKFDSSYWEVFSIDPIFIKKLSRKFKKVEWVKPDFLN